MKTKLKIEVNPQQLREIQKIVFRSGGAWSSESGAKTKSSNILYIMNNGMLSWERNILEYSKDYKEVDADDYIREHTEFPIYKKIKLDNSFIVKFSDINCGEVISIKDTRHGYNVNHKSNHWDAFYENCWENLTEEEINNLNEKCKTSDKEELKFEQGEKVIATRFTESGEEVTWTGVYFGFHDGVFLIDKDDFSVKIADKVEKIKYHTKEEAKSKIEKIFNDYLDYADRIRLIKECIDLIKI